jgi:hypothetical protein
MLLYIISAYLPLLGLCHTGFLISSVHGLLKKNTYRNVAVSGMYNVIFLLFLHSLDVVAKIFEGCPRVIGECYLDNYETWNILIVLPAMGLWLLINLILLAKIIYMPLKNLFIRKA